MEIIRGLHNVRPEHHGCVVTIGNFDGVHRGHQAVLARLVESARARKLPALVLLFEPQPQEYFLPRPPARLMRLREKIEALGQRGVDRVLCARFNAPLAALEPEAFIDRILLDGLGARYLIVGDDFRFGKDRRGDFAMLVDAGVRNGFEVASTPAVTIGGERVSSTRIRAALRTGDLSGAEALLGRRYRICGRVVQGNRLGTELGVPTANIRPRRETVPLQGIYVVEVHGLDARALPGVASLGMRPTVAGTEPLLEVHLFDFDRDIYRRQVAVAFLEKLRDERRFDSVDEMARHMRLDIERARAFFRARGAGGYGFRNALNE